MANCKLNIENSRILLRPLRISDAFDVFRNIRHGEINTWAGPALHPFAEYPVSRFIARFGRYLLKAMHMLFSLFYSPTRPCIYRLAVVFKQTNRVIGIVTLSRQKNVQDSAEIGFWVGRKFWGKGLATDAVHLAVRFGFERLKLNKIEGWTFEKNVGSRRVMEKCGFRLESVVENAYLKYNESQTRLNYRILNPLFETTCQVNAE